MDGERFDGWLRASSRVGSRRRMLAGLAAVVAGAAVGAAFDQDAGATAAARKKRGGNVCRGKRDGASCENGGQCLNGKCNHRPNCDSAGAVCSASCCSRICIGIVRAPTSFCAKGDLGARCRDAGDCLSGNCVGFVCKA